MECGVAFHFIFSKQNMEYLEASCDLLALISMDGGHDRGHLERKFRVG
jgi:hypothetical protein